MNRQFTKLEFTLFMLSLIIVISGILLPETSVVNILVGIGIIIALLILHINTAKIVNLSEDNPKVKTMKRLNLFSLFLVVLPFGIFNWIPIPADSIFRSNTEFLIVLAIIIVIGNTAPKLPFSRFVGLRLPWTIRDEATWKAAHKVLGYTTFPVVAAMIIASFFVDKVETIGIYGVLSWVIIPSLYSLIFYYRRMDKII